MWHRLGHLSKEGLSSDGTVYFLPLFLSPTAVSALLMERGDIMGETMWEAKERGTQVERDTATHEEDVCCGGCPDGRGQIQARKGEAGWVGEDRGGRSRGARDT